MNQAPTWRASRRSINNAASIIPSSAILVAIAFSVLGFIAPGGELFKFTCWCVCYLLTSFLFIRVAPSNDLFEPYYSLIFLYGMYSSSAAGYVVFIDPTSFASSTLTKYYLAILLGLVSFVGAYQFTSRHWRPRQPSVSVDAQDRRYALVITFALLISLAITPQGLSTFDYRSVESYTEIAASSRLGLRDQTSSGVSEYILQLPSLFAMSLMMLLLVGRRSMASFVFAACGLLYLLGLETMRGEKAPLLYVTLFFVMHRNYRRVKIRPASLFAPVIALYVFAVMISHVRNTTNLVTMMDSAIELLIDEPSRLLPINSGELNGPPQTLMVVLEDLGQDGASHLGFAHYIQELRVWVPRVLDSTRPRPVSEQFMERFFRDEDSQGLGRGMFILTPGYWALGYFGIAIEMAVYGFTAAAVYALFRSYPLSNRFSLIYSQAAFSLIFMCVRTGLLGTFRATLMASGPLILIAFIASSGSLKSARRHSPSHRRYFETPVRGSDA